LKWTDCLPNRVGEYIEFTGQRFMRIPTQRLIGQFSDLQKINKLPVTLLEDSMKEHLGQRGAKYVQHAGVHHREYEGNISTIGMKGKPVLVRANGRAMIDVKVSLNFDLWLVMKDECT
jgi:hypothetical protein